MTFSQFRDLIAGDCYRYTGSRRGSILARQLLFNPGFKYTFWMRAARYFKTAGPVGLPLYVLCRIMLKHLMYKYGISIPYNTRIGPGLYIGHFGGIVVSHDVVIGKNCNINHGVTIGAAYGGKNPGVPTLGDQVYIGPGAVVIGGIVIGDHVAIGANAVVTRSVGNNSIVAGVPAREISDKGSSRYVINTVD